MGPLDSRLLLALGPNESFCIYLASEFCASCNFAVANLSRSLRSISSLRILCICLSFSLKSLLNLELFFYEPWAFFMRCSMSCTSIANYRFSSFLSCTAFSSSWFSFRCCWMTVSLCLNFCSIILSSWGSANVSLLLMTSSSCERSRLHSSMYSFISISVSWVRVFLMFRFNSSI